jgi:hypothetical protein
MTKRKYAFSVTDLKKTGLPKEKWPLNNGFTLMTIEKEIISDMTKPLQPHTEQLNYPLDKQPTIQ